MSELALRFERASPAAHLFPGVADGSPTQAPVAAAEPLEFRLVSGRAAFDRLEPDWNALFERAGRSTQVFQTFAWCWHWCNHFLPQDDVRRADVRLAVLTGWRGKRLAMVWPMVMERRHGPAALAWLGDPVSQYGDILVEDEAADASSLEAAWAYLLAATRPDIVSLRKVRADAAIAPFLKRTCTRVVSTEEAPYLDLASAPDFATYEQRFTGHARRNRRRLLRRLGEHGAVATEVYQDGAKARELAGVAIVMKRGWLRRRGEVSRSFADPRFLAFFADAAEGRGKSTGCVVSALRSGGEIGAVQIGFECKGRLAMHVIVTSGKLERFGAGVLHLEASIRKAAERGIGVFDLLAPRHDYKMDWADGVIAVEDHALALTLKGRAWSAGVLELRPTVKRLIGRLSPGARRIIGTLVAKLR